MALYEVSYSFLVPDLDTALAIWERADPAWPNSSRRLEDIPPTIEEVLGGWQSYGCERLGDWAARNVMVIDLRMYRAKVVTGSYGFLAWHLCHHDEDLPCENPERETWGEETP